MNNIILYLNDNEKVTMCNLNRLVVFKAFYDTCSVGIKFYDERNRGLITIHVDGGAIVTLLNQHHDDLFFKEVVAPIIENEVTDYILTCMQDLKRDFIDISTLQTRIKNALKIAQSDLAEEFDDWK